MIILQKRGSIVLISRTLINNSNKQIMLSSDPYHINIYTWFHFISCCITKVGNFKSVLKMQTICKLYILSQRCIPFWRLRTATIKKFTWNITNIFLKIFEKRCFYLRFRINLSYKHTFFLKTATKSYKVIVLYYIKWLIGRML